MNILEEILEEIESLHNKILHNKFAEKVTEKEIVALVKAKEIIRSHMDDVPKCGDCSRRKWYQEGYKDGKDTNDPSNDGWIPVSERLPDDDEKVLVTIKHSSWISDFYSEWVPEKKKIYHPEINDTYLGYINKNGIWIFMDEEGQENICDEEFGTDIGKIYDVVTHWYPLPAPHKGE